MSLLELLIVLAVVGVMAALGLAWVRPNATVRTASAARALMRAGRLHALWRGRGVAVLPRPDGLLARVAPAGDAAEACAAGRELRSVRAPTGSGVRVVRALRAGIVWRPDGSALSCAGGGVISDRMVFAGRGVQAALVISSLGRVRLEVLR